MKYFICVGHANYGNGTISSADGTKYGGVNEYKYNKELAPYVCKWLQAAGHEATLCVAPEGQLHSLNDEINYFIGEEHKQDYDLAVQLHLNAFNGSAHGCEAYAYNDAGLQIANRISAKLGTIWLNRGGQIRTGLYWTRKTKAKSVLVESFFCDSAEDYAKAQKLGMDAHGKLIAEGIVGKDIEAVYPKYWIQSGAYGSKANASAQVAALKAAGFDAKIRVLSSGAAKYRVSVGEYVTRKLAKKAASKIKATGFDTLLKEL